MDRGAWQATVHGGHKKSDMTEHIHTHVVVQSLSRDQLFVIPWIAGCQAPLSFIIS